MTIERLEHRLKRLIEMRDKLELEHKGNEGKYTYHGGFGLGYVKGQISILEDFIDYLTDKKNG